MEWIKAEQKRPEKGRMIVVKKKELVPLDEDRYAVCRASRSMYSVPFFPFEKRNSISWTMIDKWAYLDNKTD